MSSEDEDVIFVPFEQVMIEETSTERTIDRVENRGPSTSGTRRKKKHDDADEPLISQKVQIERKIEQIERLIRRDKRRVVQGPKIHTTDRHIFQFTVTLVRDKAAPKIWRRIQVPGDFDFRQFHIALQKAMGWKSVREDFHMHRFVVVNVDTKKEETIVMTEYAQFRNDSKDENIVKLRDYFTVVGHKGLYVYDFATLWTHDVVFEDYFLPVAGEKYPKCVAGEKACPRDDGAPLTRADYNADPDWFDPTKCFCD